MAATDDAIADELRPTRRVAADPEPSALAWTASEIDSLSARAYNRANMRIFPTPPYRNVPELLDSAGDFSERELDGTLRDIRRANIFGLGTWVVLHHVQRLAAAVPSHRCLRVLDLATGSADIPEELCRWAARQRRAIEIVATDLSEPILRVARQRIEAVGFGDRITYVACDANAPPFGPGSFDIVTCSLAFHHLSVCEARSALHAMARIGRVGFIVNDIYRSRGAWYMARFLTATTTNNRLTRHDGPASVLRAFTPAEMQRLSREAGVRAEVYTHPFWRVAVVGRGEAHVA